jgi:3-hydroxy-9,10-secoandrosta-1,3,5(10)-triene-9,17-dione monooxygenase
MTAGLAERRAVRTVLPVPEPDLTPAELIARAAALKLLLRQQQAENDERGFYSQELHQAFLDAGLYRTLQPRMFGGYEFDIPTFYRAMLEISHGHPSAGWCLTLCASHPFLIASHGPNGRSANCSGRMGTSRRRTACPRPACSRRPKAATGSAACGIFAPAFLTPRTSSAAHGYRSPTDRRRCSASRCRGEKLRILDDWGGDRTLGMRASGSHSVEIKDALIPAHHAVPLQGLFTRPEDMRDGTPGTRLHGNPMYLGRVAGPYHMSLITPVIGAAKAALDEYQDLIRTKNTNFPPIVPRAEHEDFQRALGQATILVDAAENLMIRGGEVYMEMCQRWASDGTLITVEQNLRLWAMLQQAGRMACDAVELLFKNAGTSVARKGSRMERYLRDAQMYRVHPSSLFENFWAPVGRARLGLPIRHFNF